MKYTMTLDEAIAALQKAKEELAGATYKDGTLRRENGVPIHFSELVDELIEAASDIKRFSPPKKQAEALQKLRMVVLLVGWEIIQEKFGGRGIKITSSLEEATKFLEVNTELLSDINPVFLLPSDKRVSAKILAGKNVESSPLDQIFVRRNFPQGVCLEEVNKT